MIKFLYYLETTKRLLSWINRDLQKLTTFVNFRAIPKHKSNILKIHGKLTSHFILHYILSYPQIARLSFKSSAPWDTSLLSYSLRKRLCGKINLKNDAHGVPILVIFRVSGYIKGYKNNISKKDYVFTIASPPLPNHSGVCPWTPDRNSCIQSILP